VGLGAILWHGDLHYRNFFGGLVFAPFAILFGVIIVGGALFKPEILGNAPKTEAIARCIGTDLNVPSQAFHG